MDSSEYINLIKISRDYLLKQDMDPSRVISLAIIADSDVQQFCKVVSGTIIRRGYEPRVVSSEYGTMVQECLGVDMLIDRHPVEFVFLYLSTQSFRKRFYSYNTESGQDLVSLLTEEYRHYLKRLGDRNVKIYLNTLPLPMERPFGNYSLQAEASLYRMVFEFNIQLKQITDSFENIFLLDIMALSSQYGTRDWLDEGLWCVSKYATHPRFMPVISDSLIASIASQKGFVSKCIVLDLDNTLWGGVIGDDGLEGIRLGEGPEGEAFVLFQHYLKSLLNRGYLLSIASKNHEDVALEAINSHPSMVLKEKDFSVIKISWGDKAQSIMEISKELNIGLNSLIFFDDSIFERDRVRMALHDVVVPDLPEDPSEFIPYVESLNLFETTQFSDEDKVRSKMYFQESKRVEFKGQFSKLDDYLKSLKMQAKIIPFSEQKLSRITQLINRSNQFNLRTQRFDQSQCINFSKHLATHYSFYIELKDEHGYMGLISAVCTEKQQDDLFISELVMSCRVLKRGVEEVLLNHLIEYASKNGYKRIVGEYIKTAKNKLVEEFYPNFGFTLLSKENSCSKWALEVSSHKTVFKTFIGEWCDE